MRIFAFFFAIAISSLIHGQGFTEIRSNVTGEGDVRIGEDVYRVDELQLNLDRTGDWNLSLRGPKRNFQFNGTWRKSAHATAALRILGGSIRNTRGDGQVNLAPDWSFGSLNLYGESGLGTFAANFRSRRTGGGSGQIGGILDQTRNGSGEYRYNEGRNVDSIRRARVVLTRRGEFEIYLSGRLNWQFLGTWRTLDGDNARLTVVDGPTTGSGVLASDFRGGFASIQLSGKTNGKWFTLDFRADGAGGAIELIDTRRGSGQINGPKDDDYSLRRANVNLYRDGTFEIVLESHRSHTYRGRWRDLGHQVELILTNVRGSGNLVRSGKSFARFAFVYTEAGRSYIVDFRAE